MEMTAYEGHGRGRQAGVAGVVRGSGVEAVTAQDNHPLTAPIYFAPLELPSIQPPQEEDTIPAQTPSGFIILVVTSIAFVATVSVGLLVYFKKRKR